MLKNQKGITLIALIITIIVMLILVGVTITVALNGGLFSKAEEATTKTKIVQVKEALAIKKAEVLADNDGKTPADFGITIDKLNLPAELETEYENKLIISKDGILYYDATVVTSKEEQDLFKTMGIEEYVETNTGTSSNSYTFTLADAADRGLIPETNKEISIPLEEFWPEDVSEELKNSIITRKFGGVQDMLTYNITCSDSNYSNIFDLEDTSAPPNSFWLFVIEDSIMFAVLDENGDGITLENYMDYADLTFTITMAE